MGKDQRGKHHGLDMRRNAKLKADMRKLHTAPKPPKQHKGQR